MMLRTGRLALAGVVMLALSAWSAARGQSGLKPGTRPLEVKVPASKPAAGYASAALEILEDKCVGCHGTALAENKLSLEGRGAMLKGGKRGPALVPGKADESLLFRMAAHRVEPVMPPTDKPGNPPLSPEELGILKAWIDSGAAEEASEEAAGGKRTKASPVVLGELPAGVQPINAVDLTASGSRLAAGRANLVQVYDVDSGLEIVSLGGHRDLIQSVRFSPDGSLLAAGSYQIVTLWSAPTGAAGKTMTGHAGAVLALAVAPDGKRAYSAGQDRTLKGWNLAEGKQEWSAPQPSAVTALVLTPDGKSLIAGGEDGSIRLVNTADRREQTVLKGHTAAVESLALAQSDGSKLRLVSASADGTARIWTVAPPAASAGPAPAPSPASLVLRGHKGPVRAVAAPAGGATVITGGDDATVRLWSLSDGAAQGTVATGHAGPILALAVSPDGKTLATGSADRTARIVALGRDGTARVLSGHAGGVRSLAFSPRGELLVTGGLEGGLKVWEAATGRGVIAFGHTAPSSGAMQPLRQVAFTSEGSLVSASRDATLRTWNFTGRWAALRTLGPHADRVLALDFSPDGKRLAAGGGEPSRSGELKIWDVDRGVLQRSLEGLHSDTIFAVRFSPDGARLASGSADKFLKVTNVSDGKELRSFEGHTHHVMAVDWKSDGKQIITGGADKVLKLWEFESGEQVRTLQEVGKQITSVRWLAGKPEVAAAAGDSQVRIWNTDNGRIVRGFVGPRDFVYAVAASADGSRIAAGGADSVLFVWNGQNSQVLRKLEPPASRPAPLPVQTPP